MRNRLKDIYKRAREVVEETRVGNTPAEDLQEQDRHNAILFAARHKNYHRIQRILETYPNLNLLTIRDADGNTALHIAIRKLEKHKNKRDNILHRANTNFELHVPESMNLNDSLEAVEFLISRGQNDLLDIPNNAGNTSRTLLTSPPPNNPQSLSQRCAINIELLVTELQREREFQLRQEQDRAVRAAARQQTLTDLIIAQLAAPPPMTTREQELIAAQGMAMIEALGSKESFEKYCSTKTDDKIMAEVMNFYSNINNRPSIPNSCDAAQQWLFKKMTDQLLEGKTLPEKQTTYLAALCFCNYESEAAKLLVMNDALFSKENEFLHAQVPTFTEGTRYLAAVEPALADDDKSIEEIIGKIRTDFIQKLKTESTQDRNAPSSSISTNQEEATKFTRTQQIGSRSGND